MEVILHNVLTALTIWAAMIFYRRPKFGKWVELEYLRDKSLKALKRKSPDFPNIVEQYIKSCLGVFHILIPKHYWKLTLSLYLELVKTNSTLPNLPIISKIKSEPKSEQEAWDYDGRIKILYSHLLSKSYGWGKEYIDGLDVDFVLASVQEILTDEQLDREFLWAMSDRSVIYNPKTNSAKPNPLKRPYWMAEEVKPPEKIKIQKSLLPIGVVSYLSVPEEYRPKLTQ